MKLCASAHELDGKLEQAIWDRLPRDIQYGGKGLVRFLINDRVYLYRYCPNEHGVVTLVPLAFPDYRNERVIRTMRLGDELDDTRRAVLRADPKWLLKHRHEVQDIQRSAAVVDVEEVKP
jgi:hypothetical protein